MTTPFLILHKVRGEPAFDIAERIEPSPDEDDCWIIPTSGHRAYPYQTWDLDYLTDISDINSRGYHTKPVECADKLPDSWPDHYQVKSEPKIKIALDAILTALIGPREKIRRI